MNFRSSAKDHTEIGEGKYADDLAGGARSPCCLQQSLDALHKAYVKWDMSISVEKVKFLVWATSKLTFPLVAITYRMLMSFVIWVVSFKRLEDVVRKVKIELLKPVQHSIVSGNKCFQ